MTSYLYYGTIIGLSTVGCVSGIALFALKNSFRVAYYLNEYVFKKKEEQQKNNIVPSVYVLSFSDSDIETFVKLPAPMLVEVNGETNEKLRHVAENAIVQAGFDLFANTEVLASYAPEFDETVKPGDKVTVIYKSSPIQEYSFIIPDNKKIS